NIPDSPKISLSIPSVKIEKITDGIAQTIPANQEISTNSGQMATLVINSKHRMILNENTSLSINPHVSEENIGCTVNLNYGRIYTQVEHDGNPCIVETANGKAIITGTTFDIEANESKTTLVVAEGSVNFTSEVGSVDVVAGYSSEIFAKSAPLQPVLCDTKQLTAWATGYELETTFAKIEAISDTFDISDLWLTANSGPINLENINYETWIEQKRDWFEREFPSIFQLYDILTVEGIQSEYQELLFTSGILWEFKYPQVSNRQYSFVTSDSLLKVASGYGFDRDWLKKKIPSINNSLTNKTNLLTEQEAFQKWIEQFRNARKTNKSLDSDILLYSLHAGTYLANTRTLIWFYIANEKTDLISENKANLLALLQDEVNEAEKFKEYIIRLFTISENCPCEEFNEIIEKVIDSLTEIMEIEGKVKEYEIGK
ncbi:MAG: FecR domain-containing protein, partial [Bacteroidales bacterium]|nr:FecR domain-containing protein [Bacteroidales bacterium]